VKIRRSAALALGVAALAIPAAAVARPGHGHANGHGKHGHANAHRHGHANGHGKQHPVGYVYKGTYEGDGLVNVEHGNAHVRKAGLVGQDVQFDLTGAKLSVADTNADSIIDATDVLVGDAVVVKARLPKHDPGSQPFAARHLVDQTNPATEDDAGDAADTGDAS
jgi:hypothetical protein